MRVHPSVASTVLASFLLASAAQAQVNRPGPIIEAVGGYTGFADERLIGHAVIGAGARFFLTSRLAIGPEVLYMIGPAPDRDLVTMANVTFDLRRELRDGVRRGVIPYVAGGVGWLRHWGEFLPRGESSVTGRFFSYGAGVRFTAGDRLFVAPEFRFGVEPNIRFTLSVGVR